MIWLGGTTFNDNDSPTWINNSGGGYAQQQQAYDPSAQYANFLSYRQPDSSYNQQQPSYSYGADYSSSVSIPPGQWNAFNHGAGGVSGNGMISQRDHNLLTGELFKGQYEEALYNKQNGVGTPMSDWQIENMRQQWLLHEGQGRTDRSTMQFARPQFEYDPKFYNELARLDHTGRSQDLVSMLPGNLRDYHTNERWGGFEATPVGTSFGDGSGGGDAWGTAAFGPETARIVVPQIDHTRNNVYNGGDLRSANDYGSYQTALLRSGTGDIGAVASIHSREGGGYSTASDDASGFNQRFGDLARPLMPSNQSMRGPIMEDENGYYRDNNYYDRTGLPADIERLGGALSAGGTNLPWMIADTLPVEIQSVAKNIYDGFNIINDMNPANLVDPRRMATNAAMDAGMSFAFNPMTWRGDGGLGGIAQYLAQPWANHSLAPMNYGMAMRLFR